MWSLVAYLLLCAGAEVKTITVDYSKVPEAVVEDLGIVAVGRTGGMAILAPSSDGNGTSAWMCYYDHAYVRDPWQVCEINLNTREVLWYDSGRKVGLWGWMLGKDGRLYTYAGSTVSRFDPREKKFEHFGPASPDGSNYSSHWGQDGKLYIGTYPNARVVQFDPATGHFKDFGPQGPERKHPSYAYRIAGNAEYIYTARGKIPWYLVALNLQTGEQQVLATVPQEGDISLTVRDNVCYATIHYQAYEQVEKKAEHYRLDGTWMKRVDALPEAKPDPAQPRRGIAARDNWEVCRWSGYGGPDGMAEFFFRKGEGEWQSVRYQVGGTPARVFALAVLSDGRIAGSTDDPYSIFIFDPKTGKTATLGKAPSHTYDLLWLDGKLYMSGYPNAPLDMYDPARPWTLRAQTPAGFPPEPTSPEANPRRVANFNRAPFMQKWSPSLALGADGRTYVACRADREKTGGCLGWYDPRTGESGGQLTPFETQAFGQVLAVNGGRTILCSTHFARNPNNPQAGDRQSHIMAYDVAAGKIVADIVPVRDARQYATSRLVEWRPGKVVGTIADPAGKGTVFFLLDTTTMTIESQVILAGEATSAPVLLADGYLYGHQGTMLYRLDPATWDFTPVAKLPAVPRRRVGLGHDLYLAVNDHLMRMHIGP